MSKEEKTLSSYEIRRLGHCKDTESCKDKLYCICPCLPCEKQDCFKPGCKCKRVHPYKG
jgi:hypothetical protein